MCGCSTHQSQSTQTIEHDRAVLTLRVEDVTCGHCAGTIKKAIETGLPGTSVEADPASKFVSVRGSTDLTSIKVITSRRALLLGIPALVLAVGAVTAGAMMRSVPEGLDLALDKSTAAGLYKAAIAPQATPVPVGSMHAWTVTVRTPTGASVKAARIGINGGMPQHGHGLPTAPQVTKDLGDGRYLIEGMKFNMRGWWTLDLAIDGPKGPDTVTFNLVL